MATVNAVAIAITVPLPERGVHLRIAHHLFDAAETLGVGAIVAAAVGGFLRFVNLPRWAKIGCVFLSNLGLMGWVLGGYIRLQAPHALDGRFTTALRVGYLVVPSIGLTIAPGIGTLMARQRWLRWLPVFVSVGAMTGSQLVLRDDYFGTHCMLAWGAVLFAGPSLAPVLGRFSRGLSRSGSGRLAQMAVVLFSLLGVSIPPPNAVRYELFRQPCSIAPWVLATLVWTAPGKDAPTFEPPGPRDRMGTHPIAPTAPPLLPPNPVVVFITVDALRGDVVNDTANDTRFPTLARLKEEGVVFAHASAPGAQTVVSISALFSGAYFSEQPWTSYGHGRDLFFYPIDRRFRSFPEALTAHGIPTANYPGLAFLRGDYGVVRGFGEEHFIPDSLPGSRLIDPLLDRLARCGSGPLFLYTHLLEPHQPYGGVKGKNDYDAYLSAVSTVDRQLGRVLKALERAFEGRWALFVSADHGEAFGEHGTREHGKTLYEELLHVPLLARSPRFPPRVVTERVGLVDIGPTILDLFGLETPPSWNGETLVPLLAGKSRAFTRPLVAEGRLRRALTLPEGLKVIDDPLRKVVEVYDLAKDPDETRNLFDADPVRSDRALAALRSFFAAHAWREGAYEPPYLP